MGIESGRREVRGGEEARNRGGKGKRGDEKSRPHSHF